MAKRIIVIFTILFFILFLSKIYNLRDYNIRQGIVVGFDSAEIIEHSRTLRSHTIYNVMRTTPIIEYYSQLDTIVYDEGKRTLLSYLTLDDSFFYTKGEKIKFYSYLNICFRKIAMMDEQEATEREKKNIDKPGCLLP